MRKIRDDRGTHYVTWRVREDEALVNAIANIALEGRDKCHAVGILQTAIERLEKCESICES